MPSTLEKFIEEEMMPPSDANTQRRVVLFRQSPDFIEEFNHEVREIT
jgi:hypothetical protein